MIKYVDQKSHCLRYVFKNRESGDVYLNVNLRLLWGQDLARALEAEKQQSNGGEQKSQVPDGNVPSTLADDTSQDGEKQLEHEGEEQQPSLEEKSKSVDSGKALASDATASDDKANAQDGTSEISDLLQATSTRDRRSVPDIKQTGPTGGSKIGDMLQATSTSDRRGSGEAFLDMEK